VAAARCLKLDNIPSKEADLTHDSGGWRGRTRWQQDSGQCTLDVSQHWW
jgi:hypothetical protein